jgi:hypothetical protein
LTNQAAFDAATNPGEKSDIWRYEILYRFGGLYVDTDFECLQCFDRVVRPFELVTGISNTGTVELNNGLVACRAKHPFMKRLISSIGAEFRRRGQLETLALLAGGGGGGSSISGSSAGSISGSSNDPMALIAMMAGIGGGATGGGAIGGGVGGGAPSATPPTAKRGAQQEQHEANMATISRTGPGLFTRTFMQFLMRDIRAKQTLKAAVETATSAKAAAGKAATTPTPPPAFNAIALPCSYFYPIPNNWAGTSTEGISRFVRQESLAVHHWARSWQRTIS